MEQVDEERINYVNEDPQKVLPYFNPFEIGLQLLAAYGWWVLGACVAGLWAYGKLRPKVDEWQDKREEALHHKNPDLNLKRMEAMEAARIRQQKELEEAAVKYKQVEEERLAKKRQDYINRNEGKGGGNRLGARSEYLPLCGAGPSGGYKAPKKKCPGGGCGK